MIYFAVVNYVIEVKPTCLEEARVSLATG